MSYQPVTRRDFLEIIGEIGKGVIAATLGTKTPLATPCVLMAGFDDSLLKFEKPAVRGCH